MAPPITIAQSIPSVPPPGSSVAFTGNPVTIAAINAAINSPNVQQQLVLPGLLPLEPAIRTDGSRQLSQMLPAYMLPSGYVFLDQFPCTATSKVDRQALAALDLDKVRFPPRLCPAGK